MTDVAFWGSGSDPALEPFRRALRAEWERRGYEFVEGPDPSAACVFNFVDPDDPKPFRRRQRSTYVIARSRISRCSSSPATPATS